MFVEMRTDDGDGSYSWLLHFVNARRERDMFDLHFRPDHKSSLVQDEPFLTRWRSIINSLRRWVKAILPGVQRPSCPIST